MTGGPLAVRRRALAGALGLLWAFRHAAWLPLGACVAPSTARPAPNAAVRDARAKLDGINSLRDDFRNAVFSTSALRDRLDRLAADWSTSDADSAPVQAALQHLRSSALPALRAAQQALTAAVTWTESSVAAHLDAVAAIGAATLAERPDAMALVDRRSAERRQADAVHKEAGVAIARALAAAADAAKASFDVLADLHRRRRKTDDDLTRSAWQWVELHDTWRALQARAIVAAEAGWLPLAPLFGTGLQPARAAWVQPAREARALPSLDKTKVPWSDWKTAVADAERASRARWQRLDADAFVRRLLQAEADSCADSANTVCYNWRAEQQALDGELAAQQVIHSAAQVRLQQSQDRANGLPEQLQAQWQALQVWRADQAAAVTAATGEAATTVRACEAAGEVALEGLEAASNSALLAWKAALNAQYGKALLDPQRMPGVTPRAVVGEPPPPPRPAPGFRQLERHALHCMAELDDEPAGFGAYTYVLVATSVGRDSPGVSRRLQRLLSALTGLPTAREMSAERRFSANTFVVPMPEPTLSRPMLDYNLRLGQSLMSFVPPGLLLPGAARRALITGNGPFLITLPGRLAAVRADWPLLFADLGQVPEAVVVDVVRNYMGDLLGQFNVTRTAWQPPVAQQVAMTLVRLVHATGDLVWAVFPPAAATPVKP